MSEAIPLLFYFYQLNPEIQFFSCHLMVCVKCDRCLIFFNDSHRNWLAILTAEVNFLTRLQIF